MKKGGVRNPPPFFVGLVDERVIRLGERTSATAGGFGVGVVELEPAAHEIAGIIQHGPIKVEHALVVANKTDAMILHDVVGVVDRVIETEGVG